MTTAQTDRSTGLVGFAAAKVPVKAASTANLVLSGEQTIDGIAIVTGDRVLVKDQTDPIENGIYVADTGEWERAKDCDGPYDLVNGSTVEVNSGTVAARLFYVCTSADDVDIDTDAITFAVVSPSSPITVPHPLNQGGTGASSAISAAANLGLIQVTGEAGTANAQTGDMDALVTAFRADQVFIFVPSVTNTGPATVTLTPSGAGALAAQNVFANGAALVGGEMVLGVPLLLQHDGTRLNIVGPGHFRNITQDLAPAKASDWLYTYDESAKLFKRIQLQDVPLSPMVIRGLIQSNNVADATNDIDVSAGAARDATDTVNIFLTAAMTKRLDAAWVVGTNQGGLDTGVIGNSDYYLWLIKRSDTGVVDVLFSLSSTAPTMPANYDYKRLIGWIKRVGGTITTFTTTETEGGGIELLWTTPSLDINLANTLTTARRTDALRVPLNFSVLANINATIADATTSALALIYCPDQADTAPSGTTAGLTSIHSTSTKTGFQNMLVRTSAAGLIAARADLATVDLYAVSTLGFTWARRN